MPTGTDRLGERVLVLAPLGRDAAVVCETLGKAGVSCAVCGDMGDLCGKLAEGAGAVLLTEEVLTPQGTSALLETLSVQPRWSDVPLVLFVDSGKRGLESADVLQRFQLENVTLLERPVRAPTLITVLRSALRARRRQYEVRDLLTQLEEANTQLHHDAFHDDLTGLPNRALFLDRLDHTVKRYKRYPEKGFAVLFMDFDRFKVVNDSLGHAVGDALLVAISQSLADCVRPADTVARLGGDEFTILLEPTLHVDEAHLVAERLQQLLLHPFELGEHRVHISASIGIVFCDREHELPDDILRAADTAMYRAKALGKARYVVFTPAMQERAQLLMSLESDLRGALERDR